MLRVGAPDRFHRAGRGARRGAVGVVHVAEPQRVELVDEQHGLWDLNSNPFFPDYDPPTLPLTALATDDQAAPDFGSFDETASTLDPTLVVIAPLGSASGSQTSSLGPSQIAATGSFSAVSHSRTLTQLELDFANGFFNPPVPFFLGTLGDVETGESNLSASFDLERRTAFDLSASLALSPLERLEGIFGNEVTSGFASVTLTGPSGVVASAAINQFEDCLESPCLPVFAALDVAGQLDPGSYTLDIALSGSATGICADIIGLVCYTPTSDGSFDVTLDLGPIPVPALPLLGVFGIFGALAGTGGSALRRG